MKLGILSDTHGRFSTALEAVKLLMQQNVDYLIHCGDVGDTRTLDALVGPVPAAFVFGNTDHDRDELRNYAGLIGVNCLNSYGVLTLDGKRIAITHGDDAMLMSRLRRPGQPIDYLFTGHTHVRHDQRLGPLRWVNPGALHRAAVKSVATLDLPTDTLAFLTLPDA